MIDKNKNPVGYWLEHFEAEARKHLEVSDEIKDMVNKKYGLGKYKKTI